MAETLKAFRTYEEQVDLLASRGMHVGDRRTAIRTISQINYYRLSGYWYPFRRQTEGQRADVFYPGTSLEDVVRLYDFDERLRTATFASLTPIELAVRARLGHELGRLHEQAHLRPDVLGPTAVRGEAYMRWLALYRKALSSSKEDFIDHHRAKYGGQLPVWVAVEILDWGMLTRLFAFSPLGVQDAVADTFNLTAPQLHSWLKSLNVVRNTCAHHGRLYNRVHALRPKLPRIGRVHDLDAVRGVMNRTFGLLSLIQHLLIEQGFGRPNLLPATLRTFPSVRIVPVTHLGAPTDWKSSRLWH